MGRSDLERLRREELIELVLRLPRPAKTSRTSSKPPASARKERREQSKPGGAKPGHAGHSRVLSDDPDAVVDHRPDRCSCCGGDLHAALPAEVVSVSERIDLPEVAPVVTQHRRLAVCGPSCGARGLAPVPGAARSTPFGPRLHAVATYLKTFQALSDERLQAALSDRFGLSLSQGGLMNLLRRAQDRFRPGRAIAVSTLRQAEIVALILRLSKDGRDRRADRRIERVSLGVPLGTSRGAHGLADARRRRGAGDDGRASARGLDLRPLHCPAEACRCAPDLPRPSRPRHRRRRRPSRASG